MAAIFESKMATHYVDIVINFSLNHHLIVVERFAYPNDFSELSCLELYAPLGSPMADWSGGRDQTKNGSTTL